MGALLADSSASVGPKKNPLVRGSVSRAPLPLPAQEPGGSLAFGLCCEERLERAFRRW